MGRDYRAIKLLRNNTDYKAYMTFINYTPKIQVYSGDTGDDIHNRTS